MSPDPQHRVASPIDELIAKISTWYTTGVKPLLGELHEPKLSELDADLANLLRTAEECDSALEVCFLGMAGVGKSTIINALAFDKEMVLPTGGVGPLTAQAMTVRYGEIPKLEIEYHSGARLNQVIFALDTNLRSKGKTLSSCLRRWDREGRTSRRRPTPS